MLSHRLILLFSFLLPIVLLAASCSFSSNRQRLEAHASQQTLEWLDRTYGIIDDPNVQKMLNRILKRTAANVATASFSFDSLRGGPQKLIIWRIYAIRDPRPNAFAIGGGNLVLTSGMISMCQSEAALASIISHEMAHQVLGHTGEAVRNQTLTQGRPSFSYTLENELEADKLGLTILTLARYDTAHAIAALSIGFRHQAKEVSSKWLDIRTAKISEFLRYQKQSAFRTQTTREFNKIQRLIREGA
jgi:predicted Zn-dependent protease